jgi:hypothetical protein
MNRWIITRSRLLLSSKLTWGLTVAQALDPYTIAAIEGVKEPVVRLETKILNEIKILAQVDLILKDFQCRATTKSFKFNILRITRL